MRTPIKQFAEGEGVSIRFLYKEAAAGRLVMTKVGSRTFIDAEDAARWHALAPKVNGSAADSALAAAEEKLADLSRAVAEGRIDRALVAARLQAAVRSSGLIQEAAAT